MSYPENPTDKTGKKKRNKPGDLDVKGPAESPSPDTEIDGMISASIKRLDVAYTSNKSYLSFENLTVGDTLKGVHDKSNRVVEKFSNQIISYLPTDNIKGIFTSKLKDELAKAEEDEVSIRTAFKNAIALTQKDEAVKNYEEKIFAPIWHTKKQIDNTLAKGNAEIKEVNAYNEETILCYLPDEQPKIRQLINVNEKNLDKDPEVSRRKFAIALRTKTNDCISKSVDLHIPLPPPSSPKTSMQQTQQQGAQFQATIKELDDLNKQNPPSIAPPVTTQQELSSKLQTGMRTAGSKSSAQLTNNAQSVLKIKESIEQRIKEFKSEDIKWRLDLSPDKKKLTVTDMQGDKKQLFEVRETADNSTEFNFPSDPKLNYKTALITLDACKEPINLSSRSFHDMDTFCQASVVLKKKIIFSPDTLEFLEKERKNLDSYPTLKKTFEEQLKPEDPKQTPKR